LTKIKKIIIPLIILIVLIITVAYICTSISTRTHLNGFSKQLIIDATEDAGVLSEKYQGIVSEENYERISIPPPENGYPEDFYKIDSASTKLYWGKAETTCEYTYHYNSYSDGEIINSVLQDRAVIYYKFENGKWVIYDFLVYP
jgi:hypothetical protein